MFIGVDVGTSSARAAVFSKQGQLIDLCVQPIKVFHSEAQVYEQSSDDIWSAISKAVQSVVGNGNVRDEIRGIGFTATCSLVVIDQACREVSVGKSGHNIVRFYLKKFFFKDLWDRFCGWIIEPCKKRNLSMKKSNCRVKRRF
jgi:ribulose kinase